jgi:hypothetical protein
VVDLDAGNLFHRRDRRGAARLVALEGDLVGQLATVGVQQLVFLGGHGQAIRLVDLAAGLAVVGLRVVDEVVARDGEADRLAAARRDVDQDQRVRVVAAAAVLDSLLAARVHRVQDVFRQDLAVPVGTALQAHQQDVHLADGRLVPGNDMRAAHVVHVGDPLVREAAHHQDHRRGNAASQVADFPGVAPQRRGASRPSPEHRANLRAPG